MAYEPSNPPSDPADVAAWAMRELVQVARLLNGGQRVWRYEVSYKAPDRIQDGDTVFADGTSWNPGSGRGVYERRSGAWVKL